MEYAHTQMQDAGENEIRFLEDWCEAKHPVEFN